ncbi:hypothetical protein [Alteromonas sp. BMJM2]|uniref:hypothetical protein n=1 Tax=Alteromonas sp. BMJM2 TaxID=2954241 RepID=UPI0022B3BE6F|nr:hypothetical protein [Alteromonas sp. BMJM2]
MPKTLVSTNGNTHNSMCDNTVFNPVDTAMTPLELAAARHKINVDVLVTSAFLRSLPQLGEVVLATMPQSIISILASAAGASVTYLANKTLLEQHGLSYFEASKTAGVESVCFDATSTILEISPKVQAGFEGLGQRSQHLTITTPDTFLSSRVNVSWLALPRLSLSILEVTEFTIEQHRPLLSGVVTKESIESMVAWCKYNNYCGVTNSLASLESEDEDTYCWLVPNPDILHSVEVLVGKYAGPVSTKLPMDMLAQQAWPVLTETNDKLAHQTLDYLLHRRRWYYLDKLLNMGLYPIETDGVNFWRWLGSDGVRLFLPLRASGHYTLSFNVFSVAEGLEKATLRCFVNGRLKATQIVSAGATVNIPYFAETDGSLAELLIVTEQKIQVADKTLSISISDLTVNWEEMPL